MSALKILTNLDDNVLTATIESVYEWNIRAHGLARGHFCPCVGAGSEMFGNVVVWISGEASVSWPVSPRVGEAFFAGPCDRPAYAGRSPVVITDV